MMRRCSVMRMPLDAHRASILDFGVFTRSSQPPIIRPGQWRVYCGKNCVESDQIAAQHQGGGGNAWGLLIVAGAPPDLTKSRPMVEPARRFVVLVDLKKYGLDTKTG